LHEEDYICEPVDYEAALAAWEEDQAPHAGNRVTELHALSFKMTASAREAARIFEIGGRAKIEAVVESGSQEEAAKLLRSNRNPLQRLKRLIWVLQVQDVPMYEDLMDETSEVVQAVQYCE
jgi:ribosomal protein L4